MKSFSLKTNNLEQKIVLLASSNQGKNFKKLNP